MTRMSAHGTPELITGPWRATRLWNDLVRTFHSGIPLKKHRKNMKAVENSFSGSEAVEFLFKYLKKNPNFGPDVSREQTVQLLKKMYRAKVMERVDSSDDNEPNFTSGELFRLVEDATENLRTPGKKSPNRRVLLSLDQNTPFKTKSRLHKESAKDTEDDKWETKSESGILDQKKSRKSKSKLTPEMKEDLNKTYFQSLPANSLIILDNDSTWKEAYVRQLTNTLSDAHVRCLDINITHIIYNMTKVSAKGIVQLDSWDPHQDLPHWVLSALKCLANWPRPMKMMDGQESTLPNYPAFINDVFRVVKDYFITSGKPLIPYDLFDAFISAHVNAEVHGWRAKNKSTLNNCTQSKALQQTSTPTTDDPARPTFYAMMNSTDSLSEDFLLCKNYERTARIRPTLELRPSTNCSPSSQTSSFGETSTSMGSFAFSEDFRYPNVGDNDMGTASVMRNFLPPNSCFETAFMYERPVTRIVPQKENETLHFQRMRSLSRASCYTPIPSGGSCPAWDTRSIATQTSQDGDEKVPEKKQPRWKRSSRQRKSIAVMENHKTDASCKVGIVNPAFERTTPKKKEYSSVDNLLDGKPSSSASDKLFLDRYRKSRDSLRLDDTSKIGDDNIIFSKTVRKEKKKQKYKRERAHSVDRINSRRSSVVGPGYVNLALERHSPSVSYNPNGAESSNNYYHMSRYNNLTVKTPINPPAYVDIFPSDLPCVRAEPYHPDQMNEKVDSRFGELSPEGVQSAIDSFKLLSLLLPPPNRRKLQLLLKFMKRVSSNPQLNLGCDKGNFSLVLETFCSSILRPSGMSSYDEELCRKITVFFINHYDAIWMPPSSLRKEVEDKVYQSLVNRRIKAGEDPYPITYCKRVSAETYDQERTIGVKNALQDLLDQILSSTKLTQNEKRKKIKKFREEYPDIYYAKFPSEESEPAFMRSKLNLSTSMSKKMSSLSKIRNAIRI